MSVLDHVKHCWEGQERADDAFVNSDTKAFLSSLFVHLSVLLIVALLVHIEPMLEEQMTVVILPEEQREELLEELNLSLDITITEDPKAQIGATTMGVVEEAAPPPIGEMIQLSAPSELADMSKDLSAVNVTMTELFSNHSTALFEDLAGIQGAVVNAQGDRGSVDRITTEILARLELSDVLVVWLMDASESLRLRRGQIIQHFDRVYDELDELAVDRGDALLTSVASFGRGMKVLTPEPTSDRSAIQAAVGDIEADQSGVENVFTAIKGIAATYADVAKTGRKVMMIVVTDERGNDLPALDEAVAMVQRNKMSVYVMGPLAPFARDEVKVKWTDPETKDSYYLPVDRGPETVYVEHATLAIWKDGPGSGMLSSGFGPYGLTRITHQNGGLYLLHDDGRIPGPSFDVQNLLRYHPDYVSPADYENLAARHPSRLAVLRTAQVSNEMLKKRPPRLFLAAGIQFEIKPVKKTLANTLDVIHRGLNELGAVKKARGKETSPRWQAHYDLLLGRLLANKVRFYSYLQLLDEMYNKPKVPADGTKNAWKLVGDEEASIDEAPLPVEQKEDANLAREHLRRVMDQHSDTPWAVIARSELDFPLWFHWQETFLEPPSGVPLPWDLKPWEALSDAEKKAKLAFDKKKAERAKRKAAPKKGRAVAGPPARKKKPPPNL